VALSPAFTVAQTVGNPSVLVITDTSTGSDGTITQRRVYLQKADGTYLVPDGTTTDYIEWALADTEIEIDALDKDYGLSILVEWLNVSDVVVEDLEDEYALSLYNETFD
jgi:RecB family endonuclease NucS